jgi:tRNA threonylcarbamoyl adenosine modification protein YeaZ
VVMGVGPGPFTGLRVGMAAAHAISLSRQVPLFPMVSHDGLGWFIDRDCVVVTDARRGEVAYSIYRLGETQRRVFGPALVRPEHLDDVLGVDHSLPRHQGESVSAATLARVALDFTRLKLSFAPPAPMYIA